VCRKLVVGSPKEDVFMGALISKEHLAKVVGAVTAAQNQGATIHTKGDDVTKDLPQVLSCITSL
jgi:acyl-CoA reductase-like NAD-dependent aldehyde dehydrogenase